MATEYGTRLRAARKFAGLTQQELSKKTGIPQSTISTAERIGGGSAETVTYAQACGVAPNWLANGEGNMEVVPRLSANTTPGPEIKGNGNYPVVSSVQAGDWTELCDNFQPGDAEEYGHSHHDLGQCGYMLRVTGKSMTNTESGARYSFPEGMLLHINPHLEALPGKFVVVRREEEKAATFKRLVMVDGEMYLEAINPDWPNRYLKLKSGDVFCGVVVDASFGHLP